MQPIQTSLVNIAFLTCLVITHHSCCKTDRSDDIQKVFDCATSLDSTDLHNALIGTWSWEYIQCFWYPDDANSCDYDHYEIVFGENQLLTVYFNDLEVEKSQWHLEEVPNERYRINQDLESISLYGLVYVCDNNLLFHSSFQDGCDNLYSKID